MNTTRAINPLLAAIIIGLATVATGFGASIVKATFTKDGKVVARTIYTGPDGGRDTDPAKYWTLLTNAPQFSSDVAIKADKKNGKVATLTGKIDISIQIRNKISMGSVKTDTLTLVRNVNGKANGWHLSKEELKRVMKLMKPEGEKPESTKVDPSTSGPVHPNTEEAATKAIEGNAPRSSSPRS